MKRDELRWLISPPVYVHVTKNPVNFSRKVNETVYIREFQLKIVDYISR